jgi:hypothetical protein
LRQSLGSWNGGLAELQVAGSAGNYWQLGDLLEPGGGVRESLAEACVETETVWHEERYEHGDVGQGEVSTDKPIFVSEVLVKELDVFLEGVNCSLVGSGIDLPAEGAETHRVSVGTDARLSEGAPLLDFGLLEGSRSNESSLPRFTNDELRNSGALGDNSAVWKLSDWEVVVGLLLGELWGLLLLLIDENELHWVTTVVSSDTWGVSEEVWRVVLIKLHSLILACF